jgi:hypothetical protein
MPSMPLFDAVLRVSRGILRYPGQLPGRFTLGFEGGLGRGTDIALYRISAGIALTIGVLSGPMGGHGTVDGHQLGFAPK